MIHVERLSRRYGRRWALQDVTFRIRDGSVVMIAGPNGSGKSTLFRVLATAMRAGSRGHEGDNDGRDAIVSLLEKGETDRDNTPVYGCPLFAPENKITQTEGK